MTPDCCGVLGWLVGHKFVSCLVHSTPASVATIEALGLYREDLYSLQVAIKEAATSEYTILCRRCGRKPATCP